VSKRIDIAPNISEISHGGESLGQVSGDEETLSI